MGISRRKSRPVWVDGKPFRFLVKETHVPDHQDQLEISVTVQEETEDPGRVLQFRLPYKYPLGPMGVRDVVRQALQAGWAPSTRGGPFVLEDFEYP